MLGKCDFPTSILYHPCMMASDVFVNRQHCPILVAQWQNAVTRKDMAEAYSYEDFKEVFKQVPFIAQKYADTTKENDSCSSILVFLLKH